MAVVGERITVLTTPVVIGTGSDRIDNARPFLIRNLDASASIDLGGSGVAVGSGFPLLAGEMISVTLMLNDNLFAVSSGSVNVAVLRGRS